MFSQAVFGRTRVIAFAIALLGLLAVAAFMFTPPPPR